MNNDFNKTIGDGGNASDSRAPEPTAVPAIPNHSWASTTSFDLGMARTLAEYSHQAYDAERPFTVTELPDCTVVAFRGTCKIRDWLTDLQVEKVNIGVAACVHAGFMKEWNELKPFILTLPTTKPFLVTGHSLGGALATLAAYFMFWRGQRIQAVYTFASPRVGNAGWREAYDQLLGYRTFRVAARGDIVPLIPGIFTTPRDGYRHVGREVLLTGSDYLIEPNHWFEILLDSYTAWRALKRGDVEFILEEHSIQHDYIECLAACNPPKEL